MTTKPGAMAATALRRSPGSPAAGSTLVPERARMTARPRRVAVQRARRTPAGLVRSRQAGAETAITPANGLPPPAANSAEAPPRLIPRATTGQRGASARPAATAAATSAGSATPNVLRPPERPCPRRSRATTWAHVDSWSTAAWISQLRDQFEKPCTTTTVAIASAGPGNHTADRRVPSADRSRSGARAAGSGAPAGSCAPTVATPARPPPATEPRPSLRRRRPGGRGRRPPAGRRRSAGPSRSGCRCRR